MHRVLHACSPKPPVTASTPTERAIHAENIHAENMERGVPVERSLWAELEQMANA